MKGQSRSAEVAALTALIRGTAPPPTPPTEQQLMEATMEVTEQSDGKMVEETEAQQSGSTELAKEGASKA